MKKQFSHSNNLRTIFLSPNKEQIYKLFAHLVKNNFTSCYITTLTPSENTTFSHLEPKVPFYYIRVSTDQHYDAFEVGKHFAVTHDFDDVICCYPNLDFDCVKNIKERELGFSK